jgi:hypothetical protein
VIDPQSQARMRREINARIEADYDLLQQLRDEIRALRSSVRRIQPRTTTSISLVGTDGGNNRIQFDPFLLQLVRVVDSSNNEYCLEAVTPTTDVFDLSARQFDEDGAPTSALGRMMRYLGVDYLWELSPMIRRNDDERPVSPSWVQVYRELVEWAILFSLVRDKDFGTDTLIVFDGLLRSKIFAGEKFAEYRRGLQEGVETQWRDNRRRIYLAGVAKHSKVLSRYRLAMSLEHVLTTDYPTYVEIPSDIEAKAYQWSEYARGDDQAAEGGEANKFVGGKMFFVKFGPGPRDPIWPIDIFLPQVRDAQQIIGFMLADAVNGFPIPFYPQCLQRAHENAALVDFDFDNILQDQVFDGLRRVLDRDAPTLDTFRLQGGDVAQRRY